MEPEGESRRVGKEKLFPVEVSVAILRESDVQKSPLDPLELRTIVVYLRDIALPLGRRPMQMDLSVCGGGKRSELGGGRAKANKQKIKGGGGQGPGPKDAFMAWAAMEAMAAEIQSKPSMSAQKCALEWALAGARGAVRVLR